MRGNSRVGIVAFMTVALLLTGCGKAKKEKTADRVVLCREWNSYTQDGILNYSGEYIRFEDAKTQTNSLICENANCSHTDADSCGAHLQSSIFSGVYADENHLYYIADESSGGLGNSCLYQANLDGKNRKKIASLPKALPVTSVLYSGDMVYIVYYEMEDDESEGKRTVGIYALNRKTKKGDVLYQVSTVNASISGMALAKGTLYTSIAYMDVSADEVKKHKKDSSFDKKHFKMKMVGIDLKTKKETVRLDGSIVDEAIVYRGGKVFYYNKDATFYYDEATKKVVKIVDEERHAIYSANGDENIVYFRGFDDKSNSIYYEYHIKENKWKKIDGEYGDTSINAIIGENVYMLKEVNGSLVDIFMRLGDFKDGKIEKAKFYKSTWEEEE